MHDPVLKQLALLSLMTLNSDVYPTY